MINWQNNSTPVFNVTENSPVHGPNYSGVPNFKQTTGVKPGQAPRVPRTPAPFSPGNIQSFINSFPSLTQIAG